MTLFGSHPEDSPLYTNSRESTRATLLFLLERGVFP